MTQERLPEQDPLEAYWASYGKPSPFRSQPLLPLDWPEEPNRWTNGVYAFAALAAGLIIMVLLSIPAGARPIIAIQYLPPEPITVETWEPAPIEIIDLGPSVSEMELDMQRNSGECND